MMSTVIFVASWQGISMWVVEQAMLSISPWEPLGSDAQMFVRDEFRSCLIVISLVAQVGVQHAKAYGWESSEEEQVLPHFVATWKAINILEDFHFLD